MDGQERSGPAPPPAPARARSVARLRVGQRALVLLRQPLEARALLGTVMQAVSPRSARELRKIVSRSDADWNLPPLPYDADGR